MNPKDTILKARVSQPEAAQLYDRLSKIYDIWGQLTESRARRRTLGLANIQDGEHVLEAAVGTGLAFVEVLKQNPNGRNVGIDISQGMLSKAKRRIQKQGFTNFELKIGNALVIQEPDHSFDLVLCNYMFDLLAEEDWPKALWEFHRVLKPNGRVVIVNMTIGEKWGSGIYQTIYQFSPSLMGGCRGIRLSNHLQKCGFTVQNREYIQQLLFPSEVILGWRNKEPA